MPSNLSNSNFALLTEAATNDVSREGTLLLEYFEVSNFAVATNLGTAEVPTNLGEVLGVIGIGYISTFATGDTIHGFSTDGVITSGKVTVRATTVSLGDGSYVVRGFLVGRKSSTTLSLG